MTEMGIVGMVWFQGGSTESIIPTDVLSIFWTGQKENTETSNGVGFQTLSFLI